jgi:hypothetical protein
MHRENSTVNPCILMADAPMLNPRSTTAAQTHQTKKSQRKDAKKNQSRRTITHAATLR